MLRVTLIRHAESVANTDADVICGRSPEVPLSARGELQCLELKRKLQNREFTSVFCSPTLRTQMTLQRALGQETKFETEVRLHEQDVGEWQGASRKLKFTPEVYSNMNRSHIDYRHPGGESIRETGQRTMTFLNSLTPAKHGENVIVFTHQMAIRAVLQHVLLSEEAFAWRLGCDNASVTELVREANGKWIVVRVNA